MNANQEFMDERMLHAFLDGELDGAHEEVLFRSLSSNPDLRAEMQDNLAIRRAIQHDTEAFTPPTAATAAVFGALGFSIPSAASVAAGAAAGNLLRRLWMSGGSAVLAVAAAILLYLQFPLPAESDAQRVVSLPASELTVRETPALGDLPVSGPVTTVAASVLPREAPAVQPAESDIPLVRDASQPLALRPVGTLASGRDGRKDVRYVHGGELRMYEVLPVPTGFTLQVRNVALRANPAPRTVSQSEPWFRNINIGLMYALSDNHSIGIEAGQEAFPQNYNGIEDGGAVRYEQNPLAYWATAVYQFNGDALLPHVHPFAQVQLGGAVQLGALARATAGIKFKPFERIAIVIGAEGSMLLYRFQDKLFQTDKLGLTYGLAYEF
ncbi:MAG: hypothetical protein RRA94_01535 [Bacteroidota bacterium]|nr:hypothetical protein [Bacteroidota bacterium]